MLRIVLVASALMAMVGCGALHSMADDPQQSLPRYLNAHEWFMAKFPPRFSSGMDRAGVSQELQQEFFECMWRVLWRRMTNDEQIALDNSFRTGMPVPDLSMRADMQRKIMDFAALTGDGMVAASLPICPDTLKRLKAYENR